jgi:hypothetical protein
MNAEIIKCSLCTLHPVQHKMGRDFATVTCPLCGRYKILTLYRKLRINIPVFILSGITRNHWELFGKEFEVVFSELTSLDSLISFSPVPIPATTDIPAKADLILRYVHRKSTYPGEVVLLSSKTDYSVGFCKEPAEFLFCLKYLRDLNLIEHITKKNGEISNEYRITPNGWAHLSGIGAEAKDQGFIAMAFSIPTANSLHIDGLIPGISNAGYTPMRIDRKDHNNRIDDEIVAEIRKSKFVVADLTDKNAGAYFEAGFAMGLGIPVIWTCQQADIDKHGGIHFDTRQYSIVSWEQNKLDDFVKRLTQRIEATIGHGRYVPEERKKPT